MAVLLQVRGAEKSYGDQMLLDDAEVTIVDDQKVGFVGRNGAGKSTLLRVLLGDEELDKGEVIQTGTHEELVSQKDGMYRRIYDIQTKIDEELEREIAKDEG